MQVPISGYAKEGFEKVKATFEENFEKEMKSAHLAASIIKARKWLTCTAAFVIKQRNNIGKKIH